MLIKNIKSLLQVRPNDAEWVAGAEMAEVPAIDHAFLQIKKGVITDFGAMSDCPQPQAGEEVFDASDRLVMPVFVDSHTHLVFAQWREEEFVDKIKGASYAEIAAKGGGILNSAKKLQQLSEDELFARTLPRAREVLAFGTGCIEIKSGYGLTVEDELKMLRVARRIGRETPLTVKTTFLGAHAIPANYTNRQDYINLVINEMIPRVAEEGLADYIDVFCEKGFFSPAETEQIVEAGKSYGMIPKIHANQLHISGGVEVGVKTGARSVDHLESIGPEQIAALQGSRTMPTALPGAAFFLNSAYPPARQMLAAGLPLALATDYNPGSAPAGKMAFMVSLACIKMKMTPAEALNAATVNGAYAMDVLPTHGTIARGKAGSVIITRPIPSLAFIPYAFTGDVIDKVIIDGRLVHEAAQR